MNLSRIIVSGSIDHQKIGADIKFIGKFITFSKQYDWRVVISGGYGLDGYLRTITRNHRDIDLIIYGQDDRKTALTLLSNFLSTNSSQPSIKIKQEPFFIDIDFHSQEAIGNFYYVQTAQDPYLDLNQVNKLDGTIITNTPEDFPPPEQGMLSALSVEVQNQRAHLSDIHRKRAIDTTPSKFDQDIENIKNSQS